MSADPQLKAQFEAVIYAAEEPVTLAQLASLFAEELAVPAEADAPVLEFSSDTDVEADKNDTAALRAEQRRLRSAAKAVVDELIADYSGDGERSRGMEIREIAGGYRMATKPECHDAVRMFIKSLKPAMKLSLPALETLAVIAYKQPVTAPEVNEIRGVDSSGVFGSLLARKLITTAGRKQVIGRPILYKTTKEFLLRFGLKDVAELPSMDEFEKMASELEETEPVAIDEGDAATAAYEAEGGGEPGLDENAPEEPDNDSPSPVENEQQTTPAMSVINEKTEPAE
jgi:segregation and condensation protein B